MFVAPTPHFFLAYFSRCGNEMDKLERIMSRPVAKPYRSKGIKDNAPPFLNKDGHLDFSPDDIESKSASSRKRLKG